MMKKTSDTEVRQAVDTYNEEATYPALIVCEHASNFIPQELGDLGLSAAALESHIAWDLGAAEVSRQLAKLLNATCVLGGVSRLVYDCNRPPEAPDAIPEKSEIYAIPGNVGLAADDRQDRVEQVYKPFFECVEQLISRKQALVTIHSFTPVYQGVTRDVELGILHDEDSNLADYMIDQSSRHTNLVVRRNEPYGPQHGVMHTLKIHGIGNGIPNVMVEVRNDLIATDDTLEEIAQMLSGWISAALDAVLCDSQKAEARA